MTSALEVLRASVRMPDPGPSGPIAWVNGVTGSHAAYKKSFFVRVLGLMRGRGRWRGLVCERDPRTSPVNFR